MKLLPLSEAARLVGVSYPTIQRRIDAGDLTEYRSGTKKVVRDVDVLRLFAASPAPTAPARNACRVIAIANQKGGVGKTTTTANLAAALSLNGDAVLVVDCDPQGNLTQSLGIKPDELTQTLYNVLVDRTPLPTVILSPVLGQPSLSLCPANLELANAERRMTGVAREGRLRSVLAPYLSSYAYILIDCPPALGLLTLSALSAATEVIVPVDVGVFSLYGVAQLQDSIAEVRDFNPELSRVFALCNRADKTILAQEVRAQLADAFGDALFETGIRRSVRVGEAQAAFQPVTVYRPKDAASQDYFTLADEIRRSSATAKVVEKTGEA